jgi:RNA polymerase sigma-70 factor (ECF subfamily)
MGAGDPVLLADLLAAVSARDRVAFAEFYRATFPRVFGLSVSIVRRRAVAEEITQEVFLQVWVIADRYDRTRSSPMTWLMMLTHRRAVDWVRSARAGSDRENVYSRSLLDRARDVVVEEVDRRCDRRLVQDALAALAAKQREAIALAYYSGLTYREAAESLGVPLPTLKSRIRGGLKLIEQQLAL